MKQSIRKAVSLIIAAVLVTGCAGRAANPAAVNQYGDTVKSCKAIEAELTFIDAEVSRLIPATEKTGKNVALGVARAFFLFPWFFMDFSQVEQQEINALRRRHNHLIILAGEKNCEMQRAAAQEIVKNTSEPAKKDLNQSRFLDAPSVVAIRVR